MTIEKYKHKTNAQSNIPVKLETTIHNIHLLDNSNNAKSIPN